MDYLNINSAITPHPTRLDLGRCSLYLDSNRNGEYDGSDLPLASDDWGDGDDGGVTFYLESPLIIAKETNQNLFLVVRVGGSASHGRAVRLAVMDPWSVEAGELPITVEVPSGLSWYIGGYDLPVTIDGLFEDWDHVFEDGNVTLHEDPLGDAPRSSLDLYHYASFIDPAPTTNRVLMYAEIDPASEALRGTPIPLTQRQRPSGSLKLP